MQRTTIGWVFQSDLSLLQMKQRLDAKWPQTWVVGDSEWHGDYLGGRLTPEAIARIYGVHKCTSFRLNLRFVAEEGDPSAMTKFHEAQRKLLEQALPLLQARDPASAEPID